MCVTNASRASCRLFGRPPKSAIGVGLPSASSGPPRSRALLNDDVSPSGVHALPRLLRNTWRRLTLSFLSHSAARPAQIANTASSWGLRGMTIVLAFLPAVRARRAALRRFPVIACGPTCGQTLHVRRHQPGALFLSCEMGDLVDAGLAAHLRHQSPALALLQNERLLGVGKRRCLHHFLLLLARMNRSKKSNQK